MNWRSDTGERIQPGKFACFTFFWTVVLRAPASENEHPMADWLSLDVSPGAPVVSMVTAVVTIAVSMVTVVTVVTDWR